MTTRQEAAHRPIPDEKRPADREKLRTETIRRLSSQMSEQFHLIIRSQGNQISLVDAVRFAFDFMDLYEDGIYPVTEQDITTFMSETAEDGDQQIPTIDEREIKIYFETLVEKKLDQFELLTPEESDDVDFFIFPPDTKNGSGPSSKAEGKRGKELFRELKKTEAVEKALSDNGITFVDRHGKSVDELNRELGRETMRTHEYTVFLIADQHDERRYKAIFVSDQVGLATIVAHRLSHPDDWKNLAKLDKTERQEARGTYGLQDIYANKSHRTPLEALGNTVVMAVNFETEEKIPDFAEGDNIPYDSHLVPPITDLRLCNNLYTALQTSEQMVDLHEYGVYKTNTARLKISRHLDISYIGVYELLKYVYKNNPTESTLGEEIKDIQARFPRKLPDGVESALELSHPGFQKESLAAKEIGVDRSLFKRLANQVATKLYSEAKRSENIKTIGHNTIIYSEKLILEVKSYIHQTYPEITDAYTPLSHFVRKTSSTSEQRAVPSVKKACLQIMKKRRILAERAGDFGYGLPIDVPLLREFRMKGDFRIRLCINKTLIEDLEYFQEIINKKVFVGSLGPKYNIDPRAPRRCLKELVEENPEWVLHFWGDHEKLGSQITIDQELEEAIIERYESGRKRNKKKKV